MLIATRGGLSEGSWRRLSGPSEPLAQETWGWEVYVCGRGEGGVVCSHSLVNTFSSSIDPVKLTPRKSLSVRYIRPVQTLVYWRCFIVSDIDAF